MSIDKSNRYDLAVLPEPIRKVFPPPHGAPLLETPSTAYLWSGREPIPAIGDRVEVTCNALGAGVLVSYFTEHGWLGVCVKLDAAPDWHVRQNAGKPYAGHALVFGAELR